MKNKLKIIGCINERFFRLNSWQKGVFIGVLISFLSLIKFELINIFTNIQRHIFWYGYEGHGLISDDDKIDTICDRSYSICETCGKPGQARDIHGWLKTLCD